MKKKMQGEKHLQPKFFVNFNLAENIPEGNFYRRLKDVLDLRFLYKETEKFYGKTGQKSIDPTVFFRILLVGFLENIISDRRLIDHVKMRLDLLYFLDYDIDEELPWHSTISRTRKLYPEELFQQMFDKVLLQCIEKGMVSGHSQAIDSAPVKANASMDSLELKQIDVPLDEHIKNTLEQNPNPRRKAKEDHSTEEDRKTDAGERKLKEIARRKVYQAKKYKGMPGSNSKKSRYLSNDTHYSPVDPDAKVSVKPGKARQLNYHAQMAVDTKRHVITHIHADFANKKDSQPLKRIIDELVARLQKSDISLQEVLLDAGYSSGENYAYLEKLGIEGYIPLHGQFKGLQRDDGCVYEQEQDRWKCPQGKYLVFKGYRVEHKSLKKHYLTSRADCKGCPLREECIKSSHEKKINITAYLEEYERMRKKVVSAKGQVKKKIRSSTVEPVFGSLTNFFGMRKVNTRGIENANKSMLMSAIAYNLKKMLKFNHNKVISKANQAVFLSSKWLNIIHRYETNAIKTLLKGLLNLATTQTTFRMSFVLLYKN
jgi:transposase